MRNIVHTNIKNKNTEKEVGFKQYTSIFKKLFGEFSNYREAIYNLEKSTVNILYFVEISK